MPIDVADGVFEGILAVRDAGTTNMLDRVQVVDDCLALGFEEAADWITSNPRDYSLGVFNGFRCANGKRR